MRIRIRGRNLPGRTFVSDGEVLHNVHVGVQERKDPVGLVPGDAPSAAWDVEVGLKVDAYGDLDFRGPAVQGRPGERFLYLTWGDVGADGSFAMFRRAKLMLGAIDPVVVRDAEDSGRPLLADIDLSDECGGPRCAEVHPPALDLARERASIDAFVSPRSMFSASGLIASSTRSVSVGGSYSLIPASTSAHVTSYRNPSMFRTRCSSWRRCCARSEQIVAIVISGVSYRAAMSAHHARTNPRPFTASTTADWPARELRFGEHRGQVVGGVARAMLAGDAGAVERRFERIDREHRRRKRATDRVGDRALAGGRKPGHHHQHLCVRHCVILPARMATWSP